MNGYPALLYPVSNRVSYSASGGRVCQISSQISNSASDRPNIRPNPNFIVVIHISFFVTIKPIVFLNGVDHGGYVDKTGVHHCSRCRKLCTKNYLFIWRKNCNILINKRYLFLFVFSINPARYPPICRILGHRIWPQKANSVYPSCLSLFQKIEWCVHE